MIDSGSISKLRRLITENLRVQRDGDPVNYIDVSNSLDDACAKQNHAIFARRGCGKTLLLQSSAAKVDESIKVIYLNCEDFKQHTFPNVLVEILSTIFKQMDRNLAGWFGRKKKLKSIIAEVLKKLEKIRIDADSRSTEVIQRESNTEAKKASLGSKIGSKNLQVAAGVSSDANIKEEVETKFNTHSDKIRDLDIWLPQLKENLREFFALSKTVKALFLQVDDLYHLRRADQAFVVDYIHRLCKDLPIYFKIATLRHVSTLYLDRDGQPIGAQERHDYQPINIDFTFGDFNKTVDLNWRILKSFGQRAGLEESELENLFKGAGFPRLVMAGGGVPRDVLSLFLEILAQTNWQVGERIGKDEVRNLSKNVFERRIEELKQDSKSDEQGELLKGIYLIKKFCLDRGTNVFVVSEKMLQSNDRWRSLIYRLLDYRIIHQCATALTHKSLSGSFQVFAIDMGCYAHLRKLQGKIREVEFDDNTAKEKMRSAPELSAEIIDGLYKKLPDDVASELLDEEQNL